MADVAAQCQELARAAAALRRGDFSGAGRQLLELHRRSDAWRLFAEVLAQGPHEGDDAEYLDALCAQGLAAMARNLLGRLPEVELRRTFSTFVKKLLAAHLPPKGKASVWKQLALALTCTELWLGAWTPGEVLTAQVPWEVRVELLSLPPELLLGDRALPLGDVQLWNQAASSLFGTCAAVFHFVFLSDLASQRGARQVLLLVSAWLQAARQALEWLEEGDEASPLRSLAAYSQQLCSLAAVDLEGGAELASTLSRWPGNDREVVGPLLQPLLSVLLRQATSASPPPQLLPVLADLAADRWARAVLGDKEVPLDWDALSYAAIAAVRSGAAEGMHAEAALAVWQSLALSLSGKCHHSGPSEVVAGLFAGLSRELLVLLRAPQSPTVPQLEALWEARAVAQTALAHWAHLVGDSPAWQESTWAPLERVGRALASATSVDQTLAAEAEVVLWFSFTLAASWPEDTAPLPAAAAVLELVGLDNAPPPWRGLLWTQAASLASTGPASQCAALLGWVLQRLPQAAGCHEILHLIEESYAVAVEFLARNLAPDASHPALAERLLTLALADVGSSAGLHRQSPQARCALLRAMRHALAGEMGALCRGLSERVLPALRQGAASEAAQATGQKTWDATRVLLAALSAVLPNSPQAEGGHPELLLWRQEWAFVEAAMLSWPSSPAEDQPLLAASEALAAAAVALPKLLPEAVGLLSRSAAQDRVASPEVPLRELNLVLQQLQSFPQVLESHAEHLAGGLLTAADGVLRRPELVRHPALLTALFELLGQGLEEAKIQERLLIPGVVQRLLVLGIEAIPSAGATSPATSQAILRFFSRALAAPLLFSRQECCFVFQEALPALLAACCKALAEQTHMTLFESMVEAAELFYLAAEKLPQDFPRALALGLQAAEGVPEWCRDRFRQVVERRGEWQKKSQWVQELQRTVQDWQRERVLASPWSSGFT